MLERKGRGFATSPGASDVRDVARVHVESLTAPLESMVARKRLFPASPFDSDYREALRFIAEAYPEVKDRLVDPATAPVFPYYKAPVDPKRIEEITGINVDDHHTWKENVVGAMGSLLAIEKGWVEKGYKVQIPALEDYGF